MGERAHAQLITDSESKLKTQKKKDDRGFLFFNKKKKKTNRSSGRGFSNKETRASSPRSSTGSPFASFNKRKSVSPRTSSASRATVFKQYQNKAPRYSDQGMAGVMKQKRPNVRYSTGQPFTKKDRFVTPKYSSGSPYTTSGGISQLFKPKTSPRTATGKVYSTKNKSVSPRYSQAKTRFSKRDFSVSPRYSVAGTANPKKSKTVSPKYSRPGSPFDRKDVVASPRYSLGSPFSKKDMSVSPRYSSPGSPFNKKDFAVSPRYSLGTPFGSKSSKVSPKYSLGSPYLSMNWNWIKPAYSEDKDRFEVNEKIKKSRLYDYEGMEYRGKDSKKQQWYENLSAMITSGIRARYEAEKKLPIYDPQPNKAAASYSGDFKLKWIQSKSMHPSSNYTHATQDSQAIRESLRKWNILWVRLNRNKVQPDAVTDKISKPKFDRQEKDIWND